MAKATPPTSGTIRAASDDRWTCEISASPVHVHAGDDVTFTVKLIHPGIMNVFRTETDGSIDKIPGLREDQISDFYGLLNYNYDSGGFLPNIQPLNPATVFDQRAAKGSYRINVAVTAKDPAGVGGWFTSKDR